MPFSYAVILGKTVRSVARLRGGGSAFPGLFVEKIDADFIPKTLAQLPEGVIVVSGTNGKTTTTKMVVELLESQGLRVFTNRTGSNFTRGVAAALLGDVSLSGKLAADIAVLELDEAHAVHFVRTVKPRYSLLLNVLRDQLDRFGEIDTTATMLKNIADATTEKVIINREDPRLLAIGANLPDEKVAYFGLKHSLQKYFPNDEAMKGVAPSNHLLHEPSAISVLESFKDKSAKFVVGKKDLATTLKLEGIYNVYNAAAALAVATTVVNNLDHAKAIATLQNMKPAFGRGETIMVDGQSVELVLVKNPSGFRLSLQSFSPKGCATMIAINDNYADGRDMSWLWDVEFESLKEAGVAYVTGVRAYEIALRLQYDEILVGNVQPTIDKALSDFIKQDPTLPKRIFCTYTAMLAIRKQLAKRTNVEAIS